MAIVKADAYGHGLIPVAKALERNGVHALGVAHVCEALCLRKEGLRLPLVILSGLLSTDECWAVVEQGLTPVIFDSQAATALDRESGLRGKAIPIHVKIDTGMGRLGVSLQDARPLLKQIMALRHLRIEGLTSHLSSADETGVDFTRTQLRLFREVIDMARAMGLNPSMNNMANSAAIMGHKESHFDLVRPGIMLYGGHPSPAYKCPAILRSVMRFSAKVLQVRELPSGTPVSYGRTYQTPCPCRIAVLSAGYGSGLPRLMSNRGMVLIRGRKVPLVGTLCMNHAMCDVTGLGEVRVGEEAVFLGSQGQETITGDDIAAWSTTISYEVFCSVGQRNVKEYAS